jgi:glycosyltransferase involved in cell wall biosynthesis
MRLCLATHNFIGGEGQGRVNYEIAYAAAVEGHRVTLLAHKVSPVLLKYANVQWVKVAGDQLPSNFLRTLVFSVLASRWLRRHRRDFDIIQSNGNAAGEAGDVNAVHFVHSAWQEVNAQWRSLSPIAFYHNCFTALNARWEKRIIPQAKTVIAVSGKVKQELAQIGVPPENIHVILNGVDLDEFYPGQIDPVTLGIPSGQTLALFVGDITSCRKNLDTVLKAMVSVESLHLVVVGDSRKSPYPEMAQDLKIEKRVHFLGYRRDVANIMRAVDFFVFPSRYEACTLVILEAMASGLPIITATSTGGAEIVSEAAGIILESPEDIPALVRAMQQLHDCPQLRQTMSMAARSIALKRSWGVVAAEYLHVFESTAQYSSRKQANMVMEKR